MRQKRKGIFEGAKYAFHKHIASIGMCIGLLILLSAGISGASAATITVNPGESIQAAIDLSSAGDIIELAVGTHTPSDTIHIDQRADITLRGTGATREDTLIQYATFPTYDAIIINDSSYISLENFYINVDVSDGTSIPGTTGHGFIIYKSSDITISNVKVRKMYAAVRTNPIYGEQPYNWKTYDLTVKDSLFIRDRSGIFTVGLYDSTIKNTTILYCNQWFGIDLQGPSSNVLVSNCTLHHNGNAGLKIYSGSGNHIIKDNLIYSQPWGGIYLMGGYNCQVINNTIRDTGRSGIFITGPYVCNNNIITNNRIYNNARYGIACDEDDRYLYSDSQFIISNTIYGNSLGGIWNNMINYDLTVKNNIIVDNGGYGIKRSLGTITSTYNDIWANSAGDYTGTVLDKTGDISSDPLFADPANGNFHLKSTSPCIDAGDPNDESTEEYPPINMGAYGNTIEASISGEITPIPDDVYIWLEAEAAGTLTPDFEVANDVSASNGEYIQIQEGVGFRASDGEATYTIHINSTGNYVIWGAVIAPTGGNNTFFVQMDDDFEALWAINLSANWQWDAVNHWGNGEESNPEIDPMVFTLAAGEHTLKLKQREDGTKLDKMLITNNMSYVPPYIDSVSPRTNVTITPPQNESGWNDVPPVALTFFRSDSGSGISYTNYSKTSETGPWTTVNAATAMGTDAGNVTDITEGGFNVTINNDGNTTIWYYSVDLNSNVETTKDVTVKIPHTTKIIIQSPNDVTDNRLRESSPDTVLGSSDFIDVGRLGGTDNYRDVIQFNLSGFNSTDTIKSAKLSLFWHYESRDKSTTVEIYRPVEWAEGYVNWNNRANGVAWNNLGGDWYDTNSVAQGTTPYAAVTFPVGTPDNAYHEFDVTELVQSYVDGLYENTGFFIKANEVSDSYIAFRSSDWENANERPKLVVSYGCGDVQQNTLSGAVTSSCGTDIPNATVTLTTRAGAEINTTQTDSTGHYAFADVDAGFYDINATKRSYWSNTNNVTVTAEEPETADIVLCQKGDFNTNSEPADAGDLAMMADATKAGKSDATYDLDGDGNPADEDDLTLLKNVSVGVAELE